MRRILTLSLLILLTFPAIATNVRSTDTINLFNRNGERNGWWILTEDSKPYIPGKSVKSREGRYVNGRREGVWINYYDDGKTPRLIGEYADNRPAGAYFRFDRKGELVQASAVPKRISAKQSVQATNPFFSCKMMFNQQDMVAGQVFFTHDIFKKSQAIRFWTEAAMQSEKSTFSIIDYSWLTANYSRILAVYTFIRTPKNMRVDAKAPVAVSSHKPKVESTVTPAAKDLSYYYPPLIKHPKVGKGLVFAPNGFNKLYTENSEIWVDGYFVNGRLSSGKIFIYDRDGVLLKVRVYKNGVYESDGGL